MCVIGLADDYIKVFNKNKKGLKAKFKLFGQIILGTIIGLVILFHPDITISEDLGENIEDIEYLCAGINHMAFYQKFVKPSM